jgi:hypothetical protein
MKTNNPYIEQSHSMDTHKFLEVSYKRMLSKIDRLIEIEKSKKRGKLSLPLLKEKVEISGNILEAVSIIGDSFDYTKDIGELLDILNDFGIILGEGNMAEDSETALQKYNICKIILEGFLDI